jgi:hypothetical protein
MDRKKMVRDEELARLYKNPFFRTPQHGSPLPSSEDPLQMTATDKEYYWKSLLSDPLCRQQK